jgi:hypothetical protein
MKSSRFILASTLALAFTSMANAQTVIHITGSTAFRAAAHAAIESILQSGFTGAYTGTAIGSASQAIFSGTTVTSNIPVIIKTSWSGSVGGIIVLTKNFPVPDSAIGVGGGWLSNAELPASGVAANANASDIDPAVTADASFSDSFQSSTIYPTPVLAPANGYNGGVVGVIPFEWVLGNYSPNTPPAAFTNVTNQFAQAALNGVAVLSQITGNAADQGTFVQVFGRDSDSGTRLEAFAETGFGILHSPVQYDATISGGAITSLDPWPGQFTDGTSYPLGTQGYPSGGGVSTALNTPGMLTAANNPGVMIGYLGISDAGNVTHGTVLAYNGVLYSATNVEQGVYSFWSYEHVYYRSNYGTTSPNGKTVVDQLAVQIHNVAADTTVSGLLVTSMAVGRTIEGGPISLGNPY